MHITKLTIVLCFAAQVLAAQVDIFELARRGSLEDFKLAVNNNPELINVQDQRGSTPLVLACYYNNESVVNFLVDKVNDINGATKDGSPLMAAAVKGNNSIAKTLLAAGADPNTEDANQTTALHYAVMFKNYDLTVMLLESGADPKHKNNVNQSPFDLAVVQNDKRLNIIFNINP